MKLWSFPARWSAAPIAISILAVGMLLAPLARADDDRQLVESKESLYNNIYVYKQGDYYAMTFGYNRKIYTESIYNSKDDRDLPVTYTRYMTAALIYPKDVHSILEIGFGGGRTSWYLHRFLPGVSVTSVELGLEDGGDSVAVAMPGATRRAAPVRTAALTIVPWRNMRLPPASKQG